MQTSLHLRLPGQAGSSVAVWLDGRKETVIGWPPYDATISGTFSAGPHELALAVSGNLKNMLGPHFRDGLPVMWNWENGPECFPAGAAYRFYECGLPEDPTVVAFS